MSTSTTVSRTLGCATLLAWAGVASGAAAPLRFDYDTARPFDVRDDKADTREGVSVREISYAGAAGARIGATLVTPSKPGPHPAALFVHWYSPESPDSNRTQFLSEAMTLGRSGVVSLLIDTMWSKPDYFPTRDPAKDYESSVAQVRELRRALDLLLKQPGVDAKRVAYVGHDFGAMYGAVLAGVDHRPGAFALIAGTKSFSDWFLFGRRLEPAARQAVIDELAPLDPAKHVAALTAPVLFQFGEKDPYVLRSAADVFAGAAGQPKEVRFYDSGHGMNDAAAKDRRLWLATRLGLGALEEPPAPMLARLVGSWKGSGSWQGQQVSATLVLEPVLGSSFTRLAYRVSGDVGFEGTAYYRRGKDGKPEASWFDSDGSAFTISGSESADALTAEWGPEGKNLGRTTYRLLDVGRLEVVDEIKARDGNYREFGRMAYTRP
jgi:dienelactone hydrolase